MLASGRVFRDLLTHMTIPGSESLSFPVTPDDINTAVVIPTIGVRQGQSTACLFFFSFFFFFTSKGGGQGKTKRKKNPASLLLRKRKQEESKE